MWEKRKYFTVLNRAPDAELEDVVMLIEKGKKIKVIAGSFNLKDGP